MKAEDRVHAEIAEPETTAPLTPAGLGRRDFLKDLGILVVGFSLLKQVDATAASAKPLSRPPIDEVDSWLVVADDGTVTLLSGKVEVGTGIGTALLQIAAEELDVSFAQMRYVQGLTGTTPDQYVSSASAGVAVGGAAIRQAAAQARGALLGLAAVHLEVAANQLLIQDGIVSVEDDPSKHVSYAQLIGGRRFDVKMQATLINLFGPSLRGSTKPKSPETYKIVGTSAPRMDIPDKVTAQYPWLHNIRVPGMVHGRVVRPPTHGARVLDIDEGSVSDIPGILRVVRKADFVGVVAEQEWQAVNAARALKVVWSDWAGLPKMESLYDVLKQAPVKTEHVAADVGDVHSGLSNAYKVVAATYESPYQMHVSIGPSCAIADVGADSARIWSGTQGVYGLRDSLAQLLGMAPERVVVEWAHAAGCFGQNGADDVAADAVMLSQAVGTPVRVQWMRHDEHGWEPYSPARVSELRGGVDANGRIVAWQSQMWSFAAWNRPAYLDRPGGIPGNLITAQLLGWTEGEDLGLLATFAGNPSYSIANKHVVLQYLGTASHRNGPLRIRVGSMRGVGIVPAAFPVESFVDELAAAAAIDPLEFRLRHLTDPRQSAVLRAARDKFGWKSRPSPNSDARSILGANGRGVALVERAAVVVEVEVNRETGEVRFPRVVCAIDCGLIINPDGVNNQIEGNIIQGISRAMFEQVKFDRSKVTSLDHVSYPILKFKQAPARIDTVLLNRPDKPAAGAGEPPQYPVAAAIANAIFDAVGVRLRTQPFTPERIKATLAANG